jgi:hypothetical protein
VALGGRQRDLRWSAARPSQHAPDRNAHRARQVVGLIETARERSPRMQGHGDESIGSAQDVTTRSDRHRREGPGERPAVAVFERVDQLAQRSIVSAGTPRAGKGRRLGLTPCAQITLRVEG